jgi:hypothetical protein
MINVTPEAFIDAWVEAHKKGQAQGDVARALGMDRAAVSARKMYYLKNGVELPPLKRAGTTAHNVGATQGQTFKRWDELQQYLNKRMEELNA